jgi:hypothetical protein
MIRPDQIPDEVKRAMRVAWARRNNSDAPEKTMADLAAAALSAWPGATMYGPHPSGHGPTVPQLILPLPQKGGDA